MLGWALFFAVTFTLAVALIRFWRTPLRLEIAYDSAQAPARATLVFGIATRPWPSVTRNIDLTRLMHSDRQVDDKTPEGVYEWLTVFARLSRQLADFMLLLGRRGTWPAGGELRGPITGAILRSARWLRPRVSVLRWHTEIGAGDAGLTGTAVGLIWITKGFTIAFALPHLTLAITPDLGVVPCFDRATFRTVFYCILLVPAGDIIRVTIDALRRWWRQRRATPQSA